MVFPFSLSSSVQGNSSACTCVHTVFWCIVLVWLFSILNFIICMLPCIYNKGIHGFISLNFCICYFPVTEWSLHSLSCLFASANILWLFFHPPKVAILNKWVHSTENTKPEEESGRVEQRSHNLCRPWHHGCWEVSHFVRWATTEMSLSAIKVSIWESPIRASVKLQNLSTMRCNI